MSYLAHSRAHIKADIVTVPAIRAASLAVGTEYSISTTPTKTTATVSGGYIVLNDSSSWRLEFSFSNYYYFSPSSAANALEVQWYDGTSYYGNRGEVSQALSVAVCRNSATVFIPASDITNTISLIPRVTVRSTNLNDAITGGYSSYIPDLTLKVLELPA